MQDRAAAAAHLLEAALDRDWHIGWIADLLAMRAERLAYFGEVDVHRELGLEFVFGLGLAIGLDAQR